MFLEERFMLFNQHGQIFIPDFNLCKVETATFQSHQEISLFAIRISDSFPKIKILTLPMRKRRGFLVQRPLRRLRGIGVLHDLPKRKFPFPCVPRYVLFPFMQLWICLPRPCAGCSLQHSHLCRDGFRTLGNPIRGHSNPLSVGYDSHKQSTSDSMGRTYRP